jgi:hypothetical protein
MDSLQDILGTKKFAPPDDMKTVKDYIRRKYKSASSIKIDKNTIIITVPSPTLAAMIYLERQQLIQTCGVKKRLVVRGGR